MSSEEVRVRMVAMGLDLRKQYWSRIFSNVFYAGYFAHPFLEGDMVKGPQEPLVSFENFCKVNNIVQKSHSRGYEVKSGKEYAPLLGTISPVCGGNMTASLSTKMKKKYGKDVWYYTCSHKNCNCNVATKRANAMFEEWIDGAALSEEMTSMLEAQLKRTFPILNKRGMEEVAAIKANLTRKEHEIETVEYNLATAGSSKVQDICTKQLIKLEAERDQIIAELTEKDKEILNRRLYRERFGNEE